MTDRMTVKELKALLENFNENEIVKISSHTSDAWLEIGDKEILAD